MQEIKGSFTQDLGIMIQDKDLHNIAESTDKNSYGDLNYNRILQQFFDQGRIQRVVGQMLGQGPPPSSNSHQLGAPVNATNSGLAAIGKRILNHKINLQEEFMEITKLKDFWINEVEFMNILSKNNYQVSEVERRDIAQITLSLSYQGKMDYRKLMSALGLRFDDKKLLNSDIPMEGSSRNSGTLKRQKTVIPERILSEKERNHAQRILVEINQQIRRANKRIDTSIAKYKLQNDDCIPLINFRMWLTDEVPNMGPKLSQDDPNVIIIYHYLKDHRDAVSIDRLKRALSSGPGSAMPQHNQEQIHEYQQDLMSGMESGRLEIYNLVQHLKQRELSIPVLFGANLQIPNAVFEKKLTEYGFVCSPDQMQRLFQLLGSKQRKNNIEVKELEKFMTKSDGVKDVRTAMTNLSQFDDKIKQLLNTISDFFVQRKIVKENLYQSMDVNKDGTVDRNEFITEFFKLGIPQIKKEDLGALFDALDINGDGDMSFNEFSLYLEGAKRSLIPSDAISKELELELRQQISELFKQIDTDASGFIDNLELQRAFSRTGNVIDMADIQEMISQVDQDKDGKIGPEEFFQLMYNKVKGDILSQEDRMEDLQAQFREADLDHSGFLTVDEIYNVLLKMGAELKIEELIDLMNEIDVDRNGQLDIDEFIALMTIGEDAAFKSSGSRTAMLNIRKARRLNIVDMYNCFKDLPSNFIDSFYAAQYRKYKNLPSEGFKPEIDQKTLLFKDILPYYPEKPPVTVQQKEATPKIRPFETIVGAQILLEVAQGVPISKKDDFDRQNFVKRVVRCGLFDRGNNQYVGNTCFVNAAWRADLEDQWKFEPWSKVGTNPIIFRTADQDLVRDNVNIIFEFVIYTKTSDTTIKEQSCGWAELPLQDLKRKQTKKINIKGGTPFVKTTLDEVNANRTGFKRIIKAMTSKVKSQLTVSIRNLESFTAETKFQFDLLPRTCFLNKKILPLAVGYRNYLGETLVSERNDSVFKKPQGDFIVNTFAKVLDCPDILENLVRIFGEDVTEKMQARDKKHVNHLILKAKDYISRLYPLIHSQQFQLSEKDFYVPACHDSTLTNKRIELINAALRHDMKAAKVKAKAPLESLTNFKPFNLRELQLEVYQSNSKQELYLQKFEHSGIRSPSGSRKPSYAKFASPANQNQNPNQLAPAAANNLPVPQSQQNSNRSQHSNQPTLSNQAAGGSRGPSPRPLGSSRPPLIKNN